MTVAVSVVSGVVAVTSAVTSLASHAVALSVGFVVLLALVNLRGVKESGTAFALPTYAFVALTFLLLASGMYRAAHGGIPDAASSQLGLEHTAKVGGVFTVLLCLRAFASGCTALTGVEAISNGVPSFKPPKPRNAAATLTIMGALAITMFAGITALALATHARAYPDGNPSVISQVPRASGADRCCSTRSRQRLLPSWSLPRTPPSTGSRPWRRSLPMIGTCPASFTRAATGLCSATGSSCLPPCRSR
jgi:amino acid transporter